MKNYTKILIAILALVVVAGCVTTKKKGEETNKAKKGYHNLTSKYNYWFNADELLYLTIDNLAAQHKDNYNQVLELYPYAAVDPTGARGDLDNVVKKSSMAIGLHRVSDFSDDCYTMIGQAQFLKRDFETAENTFKYIKQEYNPKDPKKPGIKKGKKTKKAAAGKKKKSTSKKKKMSKRKKNRLAKKKAAQKKKEAAGKGKKEPEKKEPKAAEKKAEEPLTPTGTNPYKSGIKRTAAYPMAMIWYGRTLIERQKFNEAEFLFREMWDDQWFPNSLKKDLAMAEAQLWLKQKRYDKAIPPLQNALDRTEKKRERARIAYILYQLHERAGNYQEAYNALDVVLHSSPTYEMEFNARLHQVQAAWANKKMNSAEANKALDRMLKDDKNIDYFDQIYYVMAEIALAENNKPDAITFLRKSLDNNKTNTAQRSESYLKLADLYFESENFVLAKAYYDSTLTVMPKTDERFENVTKYANNLTEIARLIQVITANDSIVRIFYMDEPARRELAKTLKKQQEAEAAAAAAKKAAAAAAGPPAKGPAPIPGAGVKPSTFYFYNEAFVKKGKKDFSRNWGDRKLEDNWRRSNRPSLGQGDEIAAAADSLGNGNAAGGDLGDIFKGIPANEAELAVIHASTYEAMFKLGTLFRDRLENNRRCSETLEEMQKRYPEMDKHEIETWYYCYLSFNDLGNADRAKFYLNKLKGKYPNSPYTRSLTDPNFLNASKERERDLNNYYEQAFRSFQSGNFKEAYDRCQEAPQKFGSTNPLMPKFALLGALCVGNLQGNEAYCKSLGEVIARYPESPEATRAKEIARLIACKGFEVEEKKATNDVGQPLDNEFTLEDDKLHYFLVVLHGDVRLEDIKTAVSDYNRENHRNDQLRISNIFLGTDTNTPIIVIRKFDTREKAMSYYNEVKSRKDFLGETDKKQYNKEFYAVTQENYRRILKNRTLEGYKQFFEENYLK